MAGTTLNLSTPPYLRSVLGMQTSFLSPRRTDCSERKYCVDGSTAARSDEWMCFTVSGLASAWQGSALSVWCLSLSARGTKFSTARSLIWRLRALHCPAYRVRKPFRFRI